MNIDQTLFRAYDIRGLVDSSLTEEAVEAIGRAYGVFAVRQGAKEISVGRDCREHSPRLSQALFRGLNRSGLSVVDLGTCTTPLSYFSIYQLEVDGSIMVTGSHNPPEYNGLKVSFGKKSLTGEELLVLKELIEADDLPEAEQPGTVRTVDLSKEYVQACVDRTEMGSRKLKVAVDSGNGTAGPFILPMLEALDVEVVPLYCDMDPTFPNHHPDPTVEENLEDLKRAISNSSADLGLAFDGDSDRVAVVDEKGQVIWGDQMLLLFAQDILREHPGATIVSEVKCSQTLYDEIERMGGNPVMWKAGHSLIKAKMKETGALIAGEMSGHIFFAHRFWGFDDGLYAGLRFLELVSKRSQPVSELLAGMPQTATTPELRVDCPESLKFDLVQASIEHFAQSHRVIDVDGARIHFEDGAWGLIRASNTQPILVLRFEAADEKRLQEVREYVESELEMLRKRLTK